MYSHIITTSSRGHMPNNLILQHRDNRKITAHTLNVMTSHPFSDFEGEKGIKTMVF